jgi:RNA recognition motif-containing protein
VSEEEVKPKKPLAAVGPRKSDVGAGQTVFVRNLPFDADQSSLEECFSVYGTLRMALLVKDKETGESLCTMFKLLNTAFVTCVHSRRALNL